MPSITPGQCKAARALLGLTQDELAKAAGVSAITVIRFESAGKLRNEFIDRIRGALEAAGAVLIDDGEKVSGRRVGPGVALTAEKQGSSPRDGDPQ